MRSRAYLESVHGGLAWLISSHQNLASVLCPQPKRLLWPLTLPPPLLIIHSKQYTVNRGTFHTSAVITEALVPSAAWNPWAQSGDSEMLLCNLSPELPSRSPQSGAVNCYFKATKTENVNASVITDAFYSNAKGYEIVSMSQQVLLKSEKYAGWRLNVFAYFQATATKWLLADTFWERVK